MVVAPPLFTNVRIGWHCVAVTGRQDLTTAVLFTTVAVTDGYDLITV